MSACIALRDDYDSTNIFHYLTLRRVAAPKKVSV